MLSNLQKQLDNKHITLKAVAELLGCTAQTMNNKMNGTTDFTITEVLLISENLLPEYDLRYLFKKDDKTA